MRSRLRDGLRSPLLWVFLLTLAVRLVLLGRHADTPLLVPPDDDMKFYNDWSLRILHGHFTDGKAFYGLPGYAWLLAGIYAAVGFNPFAVGLLQALLEAGTASVIFLLGREVFAHPRGDSRDWDKSRGTAIGLASAAGWICFLPAQCFSLILMPTSWLVFVFWALVLWLWRTRRASVVHPWALMGLGIGVMCMMIATVLFLVPLILVAIVRAVDAGERSVHAWTRRAMASGILLVALFAGTSPAWIHNYFIAHDPVLLSAHSGLNLWIGNHPSANGYPKIPADLRASQTGLLRDSITLAERAAGHPLKRSEVSAYWSGKAKTWIHSDPAAWLRLLGLKVRNFWNAYQYDDVSIIKIMRAEGVVPPGLRFGMVAALALPGMALAIWRNPGARWIAAAVLLHMLALMSVFITERYRLCAVPGLLIFSSAFLWQVWRWLALRRWFPVGGAIGLGALSAFAVSVSPGDGGDWSLDHYNTGIHDYDNALLARAKGDEAEASGALDRSLRELQTAFAYVPDHAEINFGLGNTWLAKGDRAQAKQFYMRTLTFNSKHAGAWNNLGVISLEDRDWPAAVRCFELALSLEPDDAKTYYLFARALAGMGDRERAKLAIRKALAQRPEQREFLALEAELNEAAAPLPP